MPNKDPYIALQQAQADAAIAVVNLAKNYNRLQKEDGNEEYDLEGLAERYLEDFEAEVMEHVRSILNTK